MAGDTERIGSRNALAVQVPGKVFILGEYAVTSGSPALVAAVDRYATGWWAGVGGGTDSGTSLFSSIYNTTFTAGVAPDGIPDLREAQEEDWDFSPGKAAQEMMGELIKRGGEPGLSAPDLARIAGGLHKNLSMCIDTTPLGGQLMCGGPGTGANLVAPVAPAPVPGSNQAPKPGLGSSAAACLVATGLAGLLGGADLHSDSFRSQAGRVARLAHRRFQGGVGSGADIDTSLFGGLRVFQGPGEGFSLGPTGAPMGEPPSIQPPSPDSTNIYRHFRFYGYGLHGVQTKDLNSVRAVGRWDKLAPGEREPLQREMAALVEEGISSLTTGDVGSFIQVMDGYGRVLRRLGALMGLGVVTKEHMELSRLARGYGAGAKSCGAGGGVAVVVLPEPALGENQTSRLDEEIKEKTGMVPLDLAVTSRGMTTCVKAGGGKQGT